TGSFPRIELIHREKIDQCQIVELLNQALGKIRLTQRVDEAAGKNVDLNRGENVLPDGGVIQAPGMHSANSLKDSLFVVRRPSAFAPLSSFKWTDHSGGKAHI